MSDIFLRYEDEAGDGAPAADRNPEHILRIPHGVDIGYICRRCDMALRAGDYLHIASLTSVVDTAEELLLFLRHMARTGIYITFHKENFWLAPTPDDIQEAIFATLRAVIALEKKTLLPCVQDSRTVLPDPHAMSVIS